MSLSAMGKVPPYQDISHFRAPYKNAIFAGFGATTTGGPTPVGSGPVAMYYFSAADGAYWYKTSVDPTPRRVSVVGGQPYDDMVAVAKYLAHSLGRDVYVHRSSGPHGPVGGRIFIAYAHGAAAAMQGLGTDPMACVAPKWVYSGFTDSCVCAPGYVATHDGSDCIPLVDPSAPSVPPTGGLNYFVDPITGATMPVTTPTDPNAPPATTPAACTGYQVGSTCVPKWALWVGGGLAALLIIDVVL